MKIIIEITQEQFKGIAEFLYHQENAVGFKDVADRRRQVKNYLNETLQNNLSEAADFIDREILKKLKRKVAADCDNVDVASEKFICFKCKHFRIVGGGCDAFPDGIPDEITSGDNSHSKPLADQANDIIFEKLA